MKPEQKIQKEIIDFLRIKGYLVIKINNVGIYKKATDSYIPTGQKGLPDLVCCLPVCGIGVMVGLEVKNASGKPSEHQLHFGQQLKRSCGFYFIVKSLDETMEAIKYAEQETMRRMSKVFQGQTKPFSRTGQLLDEVPK